MDDLSRKGPEDGLRINLSEAYEVRYWCLKFDVTPEKLRTAVRHVGPMVKNVRIYLGK